MKEKEITHYLLKEGAYFSEFVLDSLRQSGTIVIEEFSVNHKDKKFYFDAYLSNGFVGIINEPTFLEIKYANNISAIKKFINMYMELERREHLVIICLADEKSLDSLTDNSKIHILGASFVSKLIHKYPKQWWMFVSSCSPTNSILFDENEKTIKVCNPPLVEKYLKKEISLMIESFDDLSFFGEEDFKRRIKRNNNPAIILGNGVSIDFGSDLWSKMSDSLFDYLAPRYVDNLELVKKTIGNTTYSSTSMSRFTIDPKKFYYAIYQSLYRKYEPEMHLNNTLVRSVVRIKSKNMNMPLLSYNYDSFVEMDYALYTHSNVKPVASRLSYRKTLEPKISHVHGFIPFHTPSKRTKVVLTQEEYYEAYKGTNWTSDLQKKTLENCTCLYVGSSMSDLYQMSIINDVRNKYYSEEKPYPWKCFALLCLKGLSTKDVVSIYNYYLNKGVQIIFTDDFKKLPEKLLSLFGIK